MYKRKRPATGSVTSAYKRPRYNNAAFKPPRQAYRGSMAPSATRGYRPNTVERKVNDIPLTTFGINTTGSITPLCIPQLGSDMNNRIGRKIVMKSVYIRGYVAQERAVAGVTGTSLPVLARMIILIDFQPNGAIPSITDILTQADPASQLNLNNRDRFKILVDKNWVLDPYFLSNTSTSSFASACNQIKFCKKYKKLNQEMIFNGASTGAVSDVNSGLLYMVWIGNNVLGVNSDANFIGTTRVRYVDN